MAARKSHLHHHTEVLEARDRVGARSVRDHQPLVERARVWQMHILTRTCECMLIPSEEHREQDARRELLRVEDDALGCHRDGAPTLSSHAGHPGDRDEHKEAGGLALKEEERLLGGHHREGGLVGLVQHLLHDLNRCRSGRECPNIDTPHLHKAGQRARSTRMHTSTSRWHRCSGDLVLMGA